MNSRETIVAILRATKDPDKYIEARMEDYLRIHVNSEVKKIFNELKHIGHPTFSDEEKELILKRDFKRLKKIKKITNEKGN
jgi:hypothetical protein